MATRNERLGTMMLDNLVFAIEQLIDLKIDDLRADLEDEDREARHAVPQRYFVEARAEIRKSLCELLKKENHGNQK